MIINDYAVINKLSGMHQFNNIRRKECQNENKQERTLGQIHEGKKIFTYNSTKI